jgi:hypothetical protein
VSLLSTQYSPLSSSHICSFLHTQWSNVRDIRNPCWWSLQTPSRDTDEVNLLVRGRHQKELKAVMKEEPCAEEMWRNKYKLRHKQVGLISRDVTCEGQANRDWPTLESHKAAVSKFYIIMTPHWWGKIILRLIWARSFWKGPRRGCICRREKNATRYVAETGRSVNSIKC